MEDALRRSLALLAALILTGTAAAAAATPAQAAPTYDITTLAGKVASLHGTAGLQIRFSAFLEEEAEEDSAPPTAAPISPPFVLNSPLDGNSVQSPNVTVNQDSAGAPQNETAIAVDPNNPKVVVAGANEYVSRTWSCTVTDPNHLGTVIPGVERLTGGQYDAGGDPTVAFDSRGNVYYAGLGFNRDSAPNTVTVNRGTINNGALTWSAPTFINQTTSPAILNDKEWIAVDHNPASPFRDRVYVTWTRFKFNPQTGAYVQSPIAFVSSSDGGQTFTKPKMISGSAHYGQGSRPVVGPDGSLYVFWDGSTRLAATDSTYVVKSTDGGATWSDPKAIAPLNDIAPLHGTAFRVNSYPAAAVAANGDVYATWTTETSAGSVAVYSKSVDGGATWSAPARVFAAATRTADGYPVTQPSGGTLNAPDPSGPVEDVFPAVDTGPNGEVYLSAYRGDFVSPWQTCKSGPPAPVGRIECDTLGDYIHNTRLDYVVTDLTTGVTHAVNTHPINTQNGFGGGFFGDYTDISVGSDGNFHAFWTDSNNKQNVVWFYGTEFVPTSINQEDVVSASGAF